MKKIVTLNLLLIGLLGMAQPTLATPEKVKPGQPKPIERTRLHAARAASPGATLAATTVKAVAHFC